MRRPSRLTAAVFAAAALLAGCAAPVAGTPVSVFADPFKVGGIEAVDGPTGLRPDPRARPGLLMPARHRQTERT